VPGYEGTVPNSLDLITYDGHNWLLMSSRDGMMTMWDITTPGSPSLAWRYPSAGDLDTPHGPVVREYDGQFYLVYAHTYGGSARNEGSVGVAVMAYPSDPPEYLADLVAPVGVPDFGFLRGVELTTDGVLYITDAGTEFVDSGSRGKLYSATLPAGLSPTGATGASGGTQHYVDFTDLDELMGSLGTPFESRISRIPGP
jgi:hypothetical protein